MARYFTYNQLKPVALQAGVGFLALRLGEWTENLYLYNALHTVWHATAFGALYQTLITK